MRTFDYDSFASAPVPNEIRMYLSLIADFKKKPKFIYLQKPDTLEKLTQNARCLSAGASNRIEGISTDDKRMEGLLSGKVSPRSAVEKEIRGYHFCLDQIALNYQNIPVTPYSILQIHGYLYQYLPGSRGGFISASDKPSTAIAEVENSALILSPSDMDAQEAVESLCASFNLAMRNNPANPLLLILQFVLDFICIQPFAEGNGRMSRLLLLLLLYRSDYMVGRYISLETMIEKTKISYFNSLQASSKFWVEGANDPWEFIGYMLGIILASYREFENRFL